MKVIERAGLALFHRLDPERAHDLSLLALRTGLAPSPGPVTSPRLRCEVAGLKFDNPIGLAAGYDKNAVALGPLLRAGFGFLEVGAATPRPQPGNPKPRLFRLAEDRAVINRFGFNNDGAGTIAARLAARPKGIPVGLNLGANKTSADRTADYGEVLRQAGAHADFVTVNVSSPNTERLRDLQGQEALAALLASVLAARSEAGLSCPVFLKIAPDLEDGDIDAVAETVAHAGIDGLIATNTTLDRQGLQNPQGREAGGLSGAPLFERSTRVLARFSRALGPDLPIIGVGGVGSGEEAYAKIRAGASAIQLYTAMVYRGLSVISEIAKGLEACLARDGFESLAEAVGTGRADWL
ncbi:MAG: quinone-dependent dihydroorotate dehydrogenase [Pseudomonadota bacterium]